MTDAVWAGSTAEGVCVAVDTDEAELEMPPISEDAKAQMERMLDRICGAFVPAGSVPRYCAWLVFWKQSRHCGYAAWKVSAQAHLMIE